MFNFSGLLLLLPYNSCIYLVPATWRCSLGTKRPWGKKTKWITGPSSITCNKMYVQDKQAHMAWDLHGTEKNKKHWSGTWSGRFSLLNKGVLLCQCRLRACFWGAVWDFLLSALWQLPGKERYINRLWLIDWYSSSHNTFTPLSVPIQGAALRYYLETIITYSVISVPHSGILGNACFSFCVSVVGS